MSTRSEDFRYQMERSGPKKSKTSIRPGKPSAARNFSLNAKKNAVYALEDSSSRPSRLSSRKSAHRSKPSEPQRLAKTMDILRDSRRPA